ncbi:MAG: hypothetical protein HRT44_10315 [Bdellovibrionales bacterium]|nr:hypothetical protein [Bdellovibrionales bacterium]NQZ19633.1 hypothetical protein [Bdellovibrionales bacterium]
MAKEAFASVSHKEIPNHYKWEWTQGDIYACEGHIDKAIESWEVALSKGPAYTREKELLQRRIRGELN